MYVDSSNNKKENIIRNENGICNFFERLQWDGFYKRHQIQDSTEHWID